jgi:hypothetical protein
MSRTPTLDRRRPRRMDLRRPRSTVRRCVAVAAGAAILLLGGAAGGASSAGQESLRTAADRPAAPRSVTLVDESWYCRRRVDLDLVRVVMRTASEHAVYLATGCTGRIGRIEVETWQKDGVKIWAGAHDLVIQSGSIVCHDRDPSTHQDGVQAQGGERVTFRKLVVDCRTSNNAAFFVSGTRTVPDAIVCVRCTLLPANSTVSIKRSLRSGVRDSTVCRGRHAAIRIQPEAIAPVDARNVVLGRGHPRCTAP